MNDRVAFRVLGPLEVEVDGSLLPLGGSKQKSVLALLLLNANRVVSVERLAVTIWNQEDDPNAKGTLQVHISNLRKTLGAAAKALEITQLIVTQAPGYRIGLTTETLDLLAFDAHIKAARRDLEAGEFLRAAFQYGEALALWRGTPLADLIDEPFAYPIATQLERLRLQSVEERLEAELAIGHHDEVLDEIWSLSEAHPLNEKLVKLLMIALYRTGRQTEALEAYRNCRRHLQDLGLDPSQSLRELEVRVLAQDPLLDSRPKGSPDRSVPTLMRASLSIPQGYLTFDDQLLELNRPITTIGRKDDRDVVIEDPLASRHHAEIRRAPTGFKIVDLGSSNGTQVNGLPIEGQNLVDGDEITIGKTMLRFRSKI